MSDRPSDQDSHDPKKSSRFTRVPDGEYHIAYEDSWTTTIYGSEVTVLEFTICCGPIGESEELGSFAGWKVRRYVRALKQTKFPSLRSSAAKDFRKIIGRNPPEHFHRIPLPHIYSNSVLLARIEEIERDEDGDLLPSGARSSVVRRIIRLVEGVPPYLQHRDRSDG